MDLMLLIHPGSITLVKNVRGMHRAGSFRSTKFLNNSKEMIIAIPGIDRWKESPDKKELETISNNERALGVL